MSRTLAQAKPLRRARFLAAVLIVLVLGIPVGGWTSNYTFTTLDIPGSLSITVGGINNAGQIIGWANFAPPSPFTRGFLYSGGSFSMFDVPESQSTFAEGINNAGQIVGFFQEDSGTAVHGFLYQQGSFSFFDVPTSFGDITQATGINDIGAIVGYFRNPMGDLGFLYQGGSFSIINAGGGGSPGNEHTLSYDINNAGQIIGVHSTGTRASGFLYQRGSFSFIDVPGSRHTFAYGINEAGQIVGRFDDAQGTHGFLYSGGNFSVLDVPGSTSTLAIDINNAGQIVGLFNDATSPPQHGFLATPVPSAPPVIDVTATPGTLWPPNGRLVPVTVSGTITDEDSAVGEITAAYEVIDEYGLIQRNGAVTVQSDGSYVFMVSLRASRNDTDADGRKYTITVSAHDTEGNDGSADAIVTVPHNQGQSLVAR